MWTEETLELASGRQQVVHRAGSGKPVLWLHGIYGFEPNDELVDELASQHTVIAPDAPGMNDLHQLDEIHDVHDLALHYDDVLDAVGIDQIEVVGHSFGAMIGAELAAHSPRRVTRLALLSPLGLWEDAEPVADVFAVPYTDVAELLYADPNKANLRSQETETGERDVEAVVALAQAMTTVAKFLWPVPDKGLRRRLYRVHAPTLVAFGEQDAFVPPSYAASFRALLPRARCELIADAGHMVQREQPDTVSKLITDFLGT